MSLTAARRTSSAAVPSRRTITSLTIALSFLEAVGDFEELRRRLATSSEGEFRSHTNARGRHTIHILRTMPAAAIDHFGGPEVLTLHVLPVPAIDAADGLIALDTAGVGPWDADIRAGWYPGGKPHFPLVLGVDGAGTIVAVGSRVRRLKVGDKVYSYSWANRKGGFYAEYVAVAAEKVAPLPKRLDLEHAGAIPTTGLTALQGIDDALHVKKGESVIVHGGSGGVGTLAIQFAKLRGARVLAPGSGL